MKLHRLSFSHAALLKIPKEEQSFFLRLANVRNDLRALDAFCMAANNGIATKNKLDREVAIHQLLFGIRLLCGTLHEAWNVIKTGWNQSPLSRQFSPRLSKEASESLKFLKRYFGKRLLVSKIRNEFAFHYEAGRVEAVLPNLDPQAQHAIITGRCAGNVFYSFAEHVRNVAMIIADGKPFGQEAFTQLHEEPHRVSEHFALFSDAVLLEIGASLGIATDEVKVGKGYNPATLRPPRFVDESLTKA